jgi:hypothetical protein
LKSTPVKQAALAELAAAGIQLTEPDLKDSLFIERRNTAWLVIARRPDANEAAAIANAWGENFDRAYQEAYGHALKADGLQRYLKSLESCLGETVAIEPVQAACGLSDLAAVQAELAKTGEEIRLERLAGKTLFAGTLYEWSGRAEVSTSPVWYDRNKFLLLGALIGLVFSLWFIEAPFMQKKVE